MEGLTAKVFRTYNASITLQQQLKELTTRKWLWTSKCSLFLHVLKWSWSEMGLRVWARKLFRLLNQHLPFYPQNFLESIRLLGRPIVPLSQYQSCVIWNLSRCCCAHDKQFWHCPQTHSQPSWLAVSRWAYYTDNELTEESLWLRWKSWTPGLHQIKRYTRQVIDNAYLKSWKVSGLLLSEKELKGPNMFANWQ